MQRCHSSSSTVVIPTFNDDLTDLLRAIRSVVNQTSAPQEIIVVDDGSSNGTPDIVFEMLDSEPAECKLTLLKKNNGGPASARNLGLRHCTTPFIAFLDSDDEMISENLSVKEKILNGLDSNYFGVYGTYIRSIGGEHKFADVDGHLGVDLVGREGGYPGSAPAYLFRTERLLDVDGFDEALVNNEDFDLVIRLTKSEFKVKGSVGPGYIRYYRDGSVSRNDQYLRTYQNVQRFLRKASENMYFSDQELARRKAASELWLGRRLLSEPGCRKLAIEHLNLAFNYIRPKGVRQYAAYLVAKLGGKVLRVGKSFK